MHTQVTEKEQKDYQILKSELKEALNYFRMDSAQDTTVLFEQLAFVFFGFMEAGADYGESDFNAWTDYEVGQAYQSLLQAGMRHPLGRNLRAIGPEFEHKPELIRRLLRAGSCLYKFSKSSCGRLAGLAMMEFFEEALGSRRSTTVYTPFRLAWELVQLIETRDQMSMLKQSVLDPASGSGAFLIAISEYFKGRRQELIDPASGSGAFLTAAINDIKRKEKEPFDLTAVEQDEPVSRCAQILFAVFGLQVKVKDQNWMLGQESALYDMILANPPFRPASLRNGPELSWAHRLPVMTRDAHRAIVQKTLLALEKGGRCALIVPDSFLFHTNSDAIAVRSWILNDFICHGIVKLPDYTFYPQAQVKSSVLFLERPEREHRTQGEVFFFQVEQDGLSQDARRQKIERNDFQALRLLWGHRDALAEQWVSACERAPGHKNMYGVHTPLEWEHKQFWFASMEEIQGRDFILLPERFRPDEVAECTGEDPALILQELSGLQAEIMELLERLAGTVNDNE